ncbi:MAG: hypothetical protein IPP94_13165 [Ignavibacteria bacterium]|nr:hypothetical protein [Ignavibacteria bacterium]
MLFNNLISNSLSGRDLHNTGPLAILAGAAAGLPVGLLGGMFAELSGPRYTEKSSGNGGSPHAMSAEFRSALDSVRAFAHAPPPELRALFTASERRAVDSLDFSPATVMAVSTRNARLDAARDSMVEARQRVRSASLRFALNWGMNFYRVVYTSRTNLGNPYRGGSNESNIWLGADVSVALPVFAFGDGGAGLSLLPHVGAGFFSVVRGRRRRGIWKRRPHLMAGLEYQTFGRNFPEARTGKLG